MSAQTLTLTAFIMTMFSAIAIRLYAARLFSIRESSYTWALVFTAAVMAYGGSIAFFNGRSPQVNERQQFIKNQFVLIYADGAKALFKTDDGVSLVMVGSSLSSAGTVVSIEKHDGRWTVSTSKKLNFVLN